MDLLIKMLSNINLKSRNLQEYNKNPYITIINLSKKERIFKNYQLKTNTMAWLQVSVRQNKTIFLHLVE
jgi:hypothetical protein